MMHDSLYFDGVGAAVKQLYGVDGFEVVTMETPRRHGNELGRCPGITIVKKTKAAIQDLSFEEAYKDWEVGNPLEPPFIYRDKSEST